MKIAAVDLGIEATGWYVGEAGMMPVLVDGQWVRPFISGVFRPRTSKLTTAQGLGRLRNFLDSMFEKEKPDLFVREAPVWQVRAGRSRPSVEMHYRIDGVASSCAAAWGIEELLIERQDVLGHFTGVRRYTAVKIGKRIIRSSRDLGKEACVRRCHQLHMMDISETSQDQADAIAAGYVMGAIKTGQERLFALYKT
jgi:hypothetical protein